MVMQPFCLTEKQPSQFTCFIRPTSLNQFSQNCASRCGNIGYRCI